MNLKITLVTPSYNQAEFLPECLQSVLSQNYPNLEYIVMDGGSTDDSAKIIRKHSKFLKAHASKKMKVNMMQSTVDLVSAMEAPTKLWVG